MAKSQIFLSSREFLFLHDSLLAKFAQEYPEFKASNIRQHYGFVLYTSDEEMLKTTPNLKNSIETNPDVLNYLKSIKANKSGLESIVETRQSLYQNFIGLKKEQDAPSTIKIKDVLFTAFLLYLGYDSIEQFRESLEKAQPPTHYRMLFYSVSLNKVEECSLLIDYAASPFEAKLEDFHRDAQNPIFQGTAIKKGYHFYINLICANRGGEEFKIICNAGPVINPEQWEVMSAAFIGISSRGIPTCGEAILVKTDGNKFNHPDGIKKLYGVLMLKRNRFNIKSSEIRHLDRLTAGGIPVSEWDHIVGTYKVYGYDYTGAWHQAKVEIDPKTYEVFYETSVYGENSSLKRVRGEISITTATGSRVVCLTTKSQTNWGRDIISCVMVDLGALHSDLRPAMASFVTLARHSGRVVSGEIMIIRTAESEEILVRPLKEDEKQQLIDKYDEAKWLNKKCNMMLELSKKPQ